MENTKEPTYRLLFEQSRDAITIVDESGQFIDANPAFIKMMGYSLDELMNMNARSLWLHPSDRIKWRETLAEQGAVVDYESAQRTKDGRIVQLLITATARPGEVGKSVFQTILRDVTDRKKNEMERERLIGELSEAKRILTESNNELVRLREKELEYLNAIKAELLLGEKIQRSFLPHPLPAPPGWELDSAFKPAHEISGDFYDAFLLNDTTLVLVIGDGSGKDISAALFTSCIQTLFRILSERDFSLGRGIVDTVVSVNKFLCHFYRQGYGYNMYATIIYGMLDLSSGKFRYVSAGHLPAFIIRGASAMNLPHTGPAVGMETGLLFNESTVELQAGDVLFAYTDGVTEAKNQQGEFFTLKRLISLLSQVKGSATLAVKTIREALNAHTENAEPYDDITMLAVGKK